MSDHEIQALPPSVEDLIAIFILQEEDAFNGTSNFCPSAGFTFRLQTFCPKALAIWSGALL